MVVQIEGARTNPSIGTLCRLAEAFGVSIGRLIEAPAEPVVRVIGVDEPPALWQGPAAAPPTSCAGSTTRRSSSCGAGGSCPASTSRPTTTRPATREVMHVHSGVLTVRVDQTPYLVRAGETIDFRADKPHEYRNDGVEPVDLTMVVVMPPGEYDRARHTFADT